jgi:hypothetical protein
MIWNPEQTGESRREAADVIADDLSALCGQVLDGDEDQLMDVAAAVDAVLAEQGPGAGTSIVALASQALFSIGEPRAARRLALLDSGVIRPAEWNVAGGSTMWVLDIRRLIQREQPALEMQIFSCLDVVLDCIADVWDDAGGRGLLGLLLAGAPAPGGARRRAAGVRSSTRARWTGELRTACVARLNAIGARRGWLARPDVLALDML